MKPMSGKEVCRLLESNGWVLRRVTGSHHIFKKEGRKETISVPVHTNKPLKQGTFCQILKSAGIHND